MASVGEGTDAPEGHPTRFSACSTTDSTVESRAGLATDELRTWVRSLSTMVEADDDGERIERIRLMEELKAAACAAQARETVAFKRSQLAQQQAMSVSPRDLGKGIGAQVALARRESPHRGARLVGLAEALVAEMPGTLAALERGETNEWRATIAVRETACLTREDRRAVDAELADRWAGLGDRQVEAESRRIAYRLDPHAVAARARKAEGERRVALRPAPDTMSVLSGLLPAAQGVAAFAALSAHADARRSAGDPRSRGQIMADTLVARLIGQAAVPSDTWAQRAASITWADADSASGAHAASDPAEQPADQSPEQSSGEESGPGVELQVLLTDQTLFGVGQGADEPAVLVGYGPIPAPLARALAAGAWAPAGGPVNVWLRRLYAAPGTRELVAMESTRRAFVGGLRRFVLARDQLCRTPWCNAPIRHVDHAVPVELGGQTSEANGQGLCEACNYAKEAPGWRADPDPVAGAGAGVTITTPTGHRYESRPPPAPGAPAEDRLISSLRTA